MNSRQSPKHNICCIENCETNSDICGKRAEYGLYNQRWHNLPESGNAAYPFNRLYSIGFRINEQSLPELVEEYEPKESYAGRPKKEPFDPHREIPETVYRRALTNVFADGVVSKYENLIPALQAAYEAEGFRLNYNKAG